jgi:hypothetical protein
MPRIITTYRNFFFAILLTLIPSSAFANRFREYTEQFYRPENAAQPLVASYLGGAGDEVITGAAFLPDGSLVLAGYVYGAPFDFGVREQVLGRDTEAPTFQMPQRRDRPNPPHIWQHRDGASFIVRLSRDNRRIEQIVRFPWGAGVITDLINDDQGNLFVTGQTGRNFEALPGSFSLRVVNELRGNHNAFVARLNPDLSGFAWGFLLSDEANIAPIMRYIGNGVVSWVGRHGYHISTRGEIVNANELQGLGRWNRGVCFKTFGFTTGFERDTNTGWEPWKQPTLHVRDSEGEVTHRLFEWQSHFAGTNWSRLISDSQARVITYDRNGNLIVGGWSDGGNSVWTRVGYDITRSSAQASREILGRPTGLPFSTWGAGVGSFAHVNRIHTETANPIGYTLLASYLLARNAPNSITLHHIDTSPCNNLLIGGASAWGLIETGSTRLNNRDAEANDYIGGDFIMILDEDMRNIRFSSALPGAARVRLHASSSQQGAGMRTASITRNGRTRVVFFGAARFDDSFTPLNPVQPRFGGGDLDGIFVLLDMEALPMQGIPPMPFPSAGGREARQVAESNAEENQNFIVNERMRNDHSIIVLRDSSGTRWPLFYRAHPVGESTVNSSGRGRFHLRGPTNRIQLTQGTSRTRRLGGYVNSEDQGPEVNLHIELLGRDRARAQLQVGDRSVQLEGPASIRNSRPTGQGINMSGVFESRKGDLGLLGPGDNPNTPVFIEWWAPGRPAPRNAPAPQTGQASPRQPQQARPQSGRAALAAAAAPSANPMRTWTSADGRTMQARLINLQGNQVTMQRDDGSTFTFGIDLLSPADQTTVRSMSAR